MAQLIDQYGKPLRRNDLLNEQASPTVSGVRSTLYKGVTGDLNPSKLARILKAAESGDTTSFLTMAEELEEKDPHYSSVMGTRKRAVSQLEITVDAASDDAGDVAAADLIRDWLDRDQLQGEIFDILDAIGKGYSATEIIWDTSESQWLPKDLIWRDPRWFAFDEETGTQLMMREGRELVALKPYKFIVHTHKSKSGLAVRGGLARTCVWMYLFKNFSIKDWVIFAETYGQPIRLGKYGSGTTKDDRDVLMRAVANIGSDAAAIIPESMMIEFIEAGNKKSSADVFEALAKYCDHQMSKAVIGQTTTVDAISGGHAVSKEHNEVREDIERSDAKQLAGTLNTSLVPAIITLNMGQQERYPRICIGRTEQVDTEKLAKTADTAIRIGIKVSARKLRDRLNLPEPEDDEDILQAPVQLAPRNQSAARSMEAAAAQHSQPDITEALAEDQAADWEPVMNPIVAMIEQATKDSKTYEEFSQKLLELADDLGVDGVAEKLAQATFAARVAGILEINLDGDKDV